MLCELGGQSSDARHCATSVLGQFAVLDRVPLDTAPLWRYGIRRRRGNVACCRLATQYTARLESAESSVYDFDTCRGDVLIRAVSILRYIESQPLTARFVCIQTNNILCFFTIYTLTL